MPTLLDDLHANWQRNYSTYADAYQSGRSSFVPNLLPSSAVRFSVYQTLDLLHKRLGNDTLRQALNPNESIPSPVGNQTSGSWLKQSRMVGVNVRTVGSFWNVVNYTLTLPALHDSIHLLPIWEPGVVGSLYSMVSWQINPEFFDVELARYVPALNTVEKQLKVVVNLLHALGRTVGMDVIPHTDRFSEMVLTHPALFEWVKRDGDRIADHSSFVYKYVEEAIWQFLKYVGAADGTHITFAKDVFFSDSATGLADEHRSRLLFGNPSDYGGRLRRRIALIRHLTAQGYETLPMTMAPPYRGIRIDPNDFVQDEYNQIWYQYVFEEPQPMSRVFGPLARYRFYESKDDNRQWELDFDRPNHGAWQYLCRNVRECQQTYGFDFMRGDMAHVQMRPAGVPNQIGPYYDPLRAIKHYVQEHGAPYFGFFAETFLAPPDTMSYGREPDHLEAIDADSTLGDLQSMVVGSAEFRQAWATYDTYLRTRRFAPNFTVMTADKDDPRFDAFYENGNLFRYFVALFLTDMPSYIGLGFELRNNHRQRGANEEYSKLYVFQIGDDLQPDKVTHGPYAWGEHADQFMAIQQMRTFAETIWPHVVGKETRWLVGPDAPLPARRSNQPDYVIWTHTEPTGYTFAASWTGSLPDSGPGLDALRDEEVVFDVAGCRVYKTNQ